MGDSKYREVQVVGYPDGRMDVKNTACYTGLAIKTLA